MASYQNQGPPGSRTSSGYQSVPREHTAIYLGEPSRTLFSTKQIRSAFVAKVYTILFFQLCVASALIAWFTLHEPTKNYFKGEGALWLYLAFAVGLVTLIILSCVESARRSYPLNFILLSLITLAYGLIAAIFSAQFNTYTVLCAFGATAFATLAIVLLAKYSPFDMTGCGCALCVLALIHMFAALILTLILVPMGYAQTASIILASTGAFLVSLYMMFDLQLIMGGRSFELSPEEYIMGAVVLYVDILNLFQYMLILFGRD